MTANGALALYRVCFSGLIIAASLETLANERVAHAVLLGAAEIVGALLLLWRRSEIVGACILLVVFAAAQTLLASTGQWPTYLLVYAASVIFIVLLGRLLSTGSEHNPRATIERKKS